MPGHCQAGVNILPHVQRLALNWLPLMQGPWVCLQEQPCQKSPPEQSGAWNGNHDCAGITQISWELCSQLAAKTGSLKNGLCLSFQWKASKLDCGRPFRGTQKWKNIKKAATDDSLFAKCEQWPRSDQHNQTNFFVSPSSCFACLDGAFDCTQIGKPHSNVNKEWFCCSSLGFAFWIVVKTKKTKWLAAHQLVPSLVCLGPLSPLSRQTLVGPQCCGMYPFASSVDRFDGLNVHNLSSLASSLAATNAPT